MQRRELGSCNSSDAQLSLVAAETPALRWKQERWGFSRGFTPPRQASLRDDSPVAGGLVRQKASLDFLARRIAV